MRKIREVLRLRWGLGLSVRQVSASVGVAGSTVCNLLYRAEAAGLSWPLPEGQDDRALEELLYPALPPSSICRPTPDMEWVQAELARNKSVTLQLLWMEYKERHPSGYQYTQFCEHYRRWSRKLDVVMRQPHVAGEKMFVDFAGQSVAIFDAGNGAISQAELFVATLGASNYVYAEVCPSQGLEHWLGAHVRALEWFGGVPKIFVPDNLKSAVTRACRYEPDLNPAYHELAAHYGAVVIPARSGKPRDKAKVEVAVQVVERSVLAALRNRRFFSLGEAQTAVKEAVGALNARPFQRLSGSRRSRFESLDRPALGPLPAQRYEYGVWLRTRVREDYHLEIDGNYYSVPAELLGQVVEARYTAAVVEVFFRGRRVASHLRHHGQGQLSTNRLHQPEAHRRQAEWSTDKARIWASGIGPAMAAYVDQVIAAKKHPEQARRACLGIVRLGHGFDRDRLEAAASRALDSGATSYRSLETILRYRIGPANNRGDQESAVLNHSNIRGPAYYDTAEVASC